MKILHPKISSIEMSVTEPPLKKLKIEHNSLLMETIDSYAQSIKESTKPLQIIIDEDIFTPIPLIKVYVGHIKEPSLISNTVMVLNNKIPLKELQHLKRVKRRDIILCPAHVLNGMSSIQEYLENHVQELQNVFDYFKEVDVPYLPPKVSTQYKEANKVWSVNFHPNKYLESLVSNTLFNDSELLFHRKIMMLCFEVAKWSIQQLKIPIDESDIFKNINIAIVFDPAINSIVAIAIDNRLQHPLQHAAILAIDNVAKTQNGGAFITEEESHQTNRTLAGINKELYTYLTDNFLDFKYGARPYISKSELEESNEDFSKGPYLCTGYYIYMLREPCVMCAMGLIHARISRAFYCFDNTNHGALRSQTKLHLNPSLNHRFEAFTGFL